MAENDGTTMVHVGKVLFHDGIIALNILQGILGLRIGGLEEGNDIFIDETRIQETRIQGHGPEAGVKSLPRWVWAGYFWRGDFVLV